MNSTYRFHGHYSGAYTRQQRESLKRRCSKLIREAGWDFDTFVVTGRSGLLMGLPLSHSMKKHLLIVSKASERKSSHHKGLLMGERGRRFVFLDDFVANGATRQRVADELFKYYSRYSPASKQFLADYVWVGECLYHANGSFGAYRPKLEGPEQLNQHTKDAAAAKLRHADQWGDLPNGQA